MAEKSTKVTGHLEPRVTMLEGRVAALEKLVGEVTKKARKQREYTDEERAAIRARLLAGQETARKKREAETKATKVKVITTEKAKPAVAEKQPKA